MKYKIGDRIQICEHDVNSEYYSLNAVGDIVSVRDDCIGVKFTIGSFKRCSDNTWLVPKTSVMILENNFDLSESDQIVNTCRNLLHILKQTHKMNTQTIEDLERTLKKLGV